MIAFLMQWDEKERGWGLRPDGWSLHASPAEYEDYLARYWASVPQPLPDEYSYPTYDFRLREIELPDQHALSRRLAAKGEVRLLQFSDDAKELERLIGARQGRLPD